MPTSVRLEPSIEKRLDDLAASTGRSKSFYIKHISERGIDQAEYEYGILRDVEDYRAGRLKTYSIEEVGEMLGLED